MTSDLSRRDLPFAADTANLETYIAGLRRYFARRVMSEDVDDLVQEVFLRMQTLRDSGPIERMDRYLFRVASAVLTDDSRRKAVRRHSEHAPLEEKHHPSEDRSPERVLLDGEALERMVAAIDSLPERTRDIFVLHRFEDMTYGSIAAQFGISVSAVEKHLMKALKVLQGKLDEQ